MMAIEMHVYASNYMPFAVGFEETKTAEQKAAFDTAHKTITKELELLKSDVNVSEDHQYSTIKYFFTYEKEHKIYRMKQGPNKRSQITLAQFLEVDSIARLLDPENGVIDSLVYYDKPGAARKEISEEEAIVASNNEDPSKRPSPTRPGKRAAPATPATPASSSAAGKQKAV